MSPVKRLNDQGAVWAADQSWPNEPHIRSGTYGHNLANMFEQYVHGGGDAGCC